MKEHSVLAIIRDHKQLESVSYPKSLEAYAKLFQRTIELCLDRPDLVASLLRSAMEEYPKGSPDIDAAISFLPQEEFTLLVPHTLRTFRRDSKNEVAEAVIAYTSLQCLSSLHPHLTALYELAPNGDAYFAEWPWRESGISHFDYLKEAFASPNPDERYRAWQCMLETRDPDVMGFAASHAADIGRDESVAAYLNEVGYHA